MNGKLFKIIAVFMSVILMLGMMPTLVVAGFNSGLIAEEEEFPEYSEGDYKYIVENNEVTIIDYLGEEDDVIIPSVLGGYPVAGIGREAFVDTCGMTSVIVPDSVKSIGGGAFEYCIDLETAVIGSGVNYIESSPFHSCYSLKEITVSENNAFYCNDDTGVLFNKDKSALIQFPAGNTATNYVIPDTVETIGWYAFAECKNKKVVTIPDSVKEIIDWAFYNSNVTKVIIGKGVKNINDGAFAYNASLVDIRVDEENPYFCNDESGVLFNKDKTKLIKYPGGNERKEYTVPVGTTQIDDNAFTCSMYLENVTFPNTVEEIGNAVFRECYELESLEIPDSVKTIGDLAIAYCSVTKVTLGSGLSSIGEWMFWGCYDLTDIYYKGTKDDWAKIDVGMFFVLYENTTMHYLGLEQTEITEKINLNYKAEYIINDFDAISYESENTSVAQIDEKGKITATGRGNTTISTTDADGNTVYYEIDVSYAWWQWLIKIFLFGWIWY